MTTEHTEQQAQEPEVDAYTAGLESANGHLSKLCDEQRAALVACEQEAKRYRLLRSWDVRAHGLYVTNGNNPVYDLSLDALLDAAIAQAKEAGK